MRTHVFRLRRGQDLKREIAAFAAAHRIRAAAVLTAVGSLSRARLRDASGVTVRELSEHLEIVSFTGTVSEARLHLHIALSRQNLSTVGGHLMDGCIVNTTAEVVLLELPGLAFGEVYDPETGYGELTVTACHPPEAGV